MAADFGARGGGLCRVRLFLASSEELREHRDAFDLKLRQLNDRWIAQRGIHLEPLRWEHFLDAMSSSRLQDEYNAAIAGCDLFVMLFRTQVGKYTAEEFEKAFGQFQATGRPRIYTYFHNVDQRTGAIDRAAMRSLWDFQDRLQALGHFQTTYETVDGLLLHFTEQLELLYPTPAAPQAATANAQAAPELQDLAPYLERRAAHWRAGAAGQLDRRFVNLTLMIDHGVEYSGQRHEALGRYARLDDLLAARPDVGAWVLVGAPGSGKSTVLQHHEMVTADAALAALAGAPPADAGAAGAKPEVCIWHRLSEYDAERSPPPAEWLALAARWPQDLPALDALRQVARVRFLLDGLNEIKAPNRSAQLAAVERWTDWAATEAARSDGLAPIFSVRTLDQSPMSAGNFEVRQIVLAPWSAEQIQAYCAHTLGPDNTLWPGIAADPELLTLAELPFNLAAQCALFRTLGRAARDRAELLGGLFWQMLAKRQGDAVLKRPGLLGDADWQHIASGKWKDTLRALPERHGCLVPWLDDALQRLHRRGRQISVSPAELLAGLQPRSGWATPDEWLQAVRSLNLIGDGGYDEFSTEPLLRCTHQLWQEFFAARGIRDWAANQTERLPDLTPPQPPPLADTLAKLGVQEPLPGPDPTHCEEPVKLAVQLVRDPAPWIAHLLPRNLALAGRAAVACLNRLDATTLGPLRQALLARSRDPAADLRLRIEAGAILGELGDPRWEERRGRPAESPASAGSPGPGDTPRHLWPTQWVAVPAGTYRLGDDRSPRSNEQPQSEVTLAAFEMAFAPVTNAEFRCFIDAGGYDDERWWRGERAATWRRSGLRNTDSIDWWRPRMLALSRNFDEGVRQYFAGNPQSYIDGVLRTYEHWTPEQIEAALERSFGATLARSPAKWSDPNFNHPSQPVVGVTLFEAQAYCYWLSQASGSDVALPTEAEWEAAARGLEGRSWPWGHSDPEPGQLNNDDAHLRRSTPVGVFPLADTPDGLTDLAGNVWEWTCSAATDRIDAPRLATTCTDEAERRALRGGAWFRASATCRATFRGAGSPTDRNHNLGFRMVRRG